MGLTRTRFIQSNTALAKIQDPITVLNSESTVANIDVGFLINRDSGLNANAVFYWSESGLEFVTAITEDTGIPNSNISVDSYANLRVGSLHGNISGGTSQANVYLTGSLIPSSNVEYDLGSFTNRFRGLFVSGNTIYIGSESIKVNNEGVWSFSSNDTEISFGSNYAFDPPTIITGNLTVTSNLTVQGTQFIANTTDVAFVDSKIELHTLPNLAPLTGNDGRDIGFKFHYYKTQDEHAFLGWVNSSGYLEWFDSGREGVGNIFTGNTYGTIKSGGLILSNNTPSVNTTTGALQVSGGVGIAGSLYLNTVGDVSANIGSFQNYANANLSAQTTNISNIVSTANTNTAAYIRTYTGNISAGNISVVGNTVVDRVFTNNGLFWYGNGVAFGSTPGGTTGQLQYNNAGLFDAAQLLFYPASGNLVGTTTTVSTSIHTGGLVLKGGLGVAGNIFAGGLNGTLYGSLFLGTTDVNYNRASGEQTLTGVGIDGTAGTATNAVNTQVSSNISSGTAYVTFVSVTSGNTAQNVNTSLTYNPNTGNLRAYGVLTDTGVYWAGNGAAFSSAPGGTTGQLQYNNSNQFTGANIVFNNSNGNLVITSTTQSTSATTGALVVRGGLGVGANVSFAGNTISSGKVIITEDTDALPYVMGSGAFHVAGGISIGKDLWVGGNIWVNNVISQTSTILQVSEPLVYLFPNSASYNYDIGAFSEIPVGGIPKYTGIVRSVQSGEWVLFSNISNRPTLGSIGITEANVIYDPVKVGNLVVANTTISSSTTTGALIVRGGAGIAGNVYANALTVTGNIIAGGGNFSGNIFTNSWIIPTANTTQNLGSSTNWWGTIFGVSQQARYADLAENYAADHEYAPGTVVVFGGDQEITTTTVTHDTRVAGVISTNPGYLMNAGNPGLPVAFTGRVPCQVRGPVNKGTVLVTSDIPGVAEAVNFSMFRPGCVLGKSLEDITNNDIKTIEVVVGRF